jgi:uncharacterized protein
MAEESHSGHGHSDHHRPGSKHAGRNYSGPWPRTPGRLLGIGLIRLYQLTLSGFIGNSCRHQPTCSEFAYEAVARHGLLPGSWLSVWRVARCNPWGTSGYDPVPEKMRWWR